MTIEMFAGFGLFVLGIVLGAVFQRSFASDSGKSKRLEQKLAETQEAYTRYQAEVSAHFMDTARKVQNLNNSYREVHEQLAKGAGKLCSDDEASDFLAISLDNRSKGQTFEDEAGVLPQMPMDYAPKETPDAEGTLSENFGLRNGEKPESEDSAPNALSGNDTSETRGGAASVKNP